MRRLDTYRSPTIRSRLCSFVPTSSAETRERTTSMEGPNGDPRRYTLRLAGIAGSVLAVESEVKQAKPRGAGVAESLLLPTKNFRRERRANQKHQRQRR